MQQDIKIQKKKKKERNLLKSNKTSSYRNIFVKVCMYETKTCGKCFKGIF